MAVLAGLAGLSMAAVRGGRQGSYLRIASKEAVAEVRTSRYLLRVRDRDGRLLTSEASGGGVFFERAGGGDPVRLGRVRGFSKQRDGAILTVETGEAAPTKVTLRWRTPRALDVTIEPPAPETLAALGDRFRSPKSEVIYGLTERLRDSPPIVDGVVDQTEDDIEPPEVGTLDRRGETVEMYVRPTFSLYAPFYQSSRGYGLSVDGTTVGAFDVAKSDESVVSFRFEAGTTPEHRRLGFHVFVGPDHRTILDEYTALTGRPLVPPDWAFLHWRWRDELPTGETAVLDGMPVNAKVAEDVQMYDALDITPGVYLFDRPVLQGEYGFAQFAWDPARLPNQDHLLAALRSRGYRIMTWSSAWACGAMPGDNGLEANLLGFIAPPGATGTPKCDDVFGSSFILDVTNPAAQAWLRDKLAAFIAANRIDGIKLDRGEEHIPSQATDVWADGRTGREVRNDYPTLQAKIHYDALVAAHPDGDFVLFSRPGYSGTQRWSIFWGGDIPGSERLGGGPGTDLGLRSAIISQQRAAFMGFPIWGSDTGGYYEFKDREVFARWIEFSAFSGIMEIGGKGTHAPWDMPTTPQYDQEMIDIYRTYAELRVTLHAYIVDAAKDAATGMPIVRPMVFLDRRDKKLRDRWDQYMFGPDLLVAPVWKIGERQRKVYFPRGTWRSFWTPTEKVRGPRTMMVDAPLDRIPVYVRGDAKVP
ncbi:MAG TPA: TIM-barrel domain-containing protein [Candidatus Eisenbacteria bacterium]|nr:TIM-barrel domain-containing protein [Candidatus Eisenbacteria bacterium]